MTLVLQTPDEKLAIWSKPHLAGLALGKAAHDIIALKAELARLTAVPMMGGMATTEAERASWTVRADDAGRLLRDFIRLTQEITAREAKAREQGQEDVLKFIREGRFLHDDAPPARLAREIEAGWRAHGKAAVKGTE